MLAGSIAYRISRYDFIFFLGGSGCWAVVRRRDCPGATTLAVPPSEVTKDVYKKEDGSKMFNHLRGQGKMATGIEEVLAKK